MFSISVVLVPARPVALEVAATVVLAHAAALVALAGAHVAPAVAATPEAALGLSLEVALSTVKLLDVKRKAPILNVSYEFTTVFSMCIYLFVVQIFSGHPYKLCTPSQFC